ncbi:MAG TPA: glycosyltransferase [Blastocatellia bacterium]|nr:glycosyltransferase [Blastocatellia bacterium]
MGGLTVLITNNTLANRAGSELYVRDIAIALLKRGHTPVAFSTLLGDVARELRDATIPVIDSLDALTTPPDIIHGQHHVETMMALLHFPSTPAIFVCHGWIPWEEIPPRFPRILRYVAVDYTCRDRLVLENGIPEDRVSVLLNFADLERFKPRAPLPSRPERALVFSNEANEHTTVADVRDACERAGIALDVIGLSSGKPSAEPEIVLGNYDLIFAKARSAIEAMSVGAAVVLYDGRNIGPMVTTREFERLRPLNFGIRALSESISVDAIASEIAKYDADDAALVSQRIRATAGRDAVIDELLSLYGEVIEEHATGGSDWAAESREAAHYLRWLARRLKENDRLQGERDWIEAEHYKLHSQFAARETEISILKSSHEIEMARLQGERDSMETENNVLRSRLTDRERETEVLEASHARQAARLEDQVSEGRQKAVELAEELAIKRADLAKITNSLGWRLLSRYGKIKYRLLLPAYKQLKQLFRSKA